MSKTFVCLLLVCLSGLGYGQDTTKILFVGNSFTFFWNVPEVVSSIARTQGMVWDCYQSTVGGSNWEQHWKNERGLETVTRIKGSRWDYVVLQNHSSSSIDRKDEFSEYGKKLIDLIKSVGATPLLYTTWSYKDHAAMQNEITAGYSQLAENTGIETVPIGPIWANVRSKYPDLNLYFDNKHPSPLGAYLIALTFFRKITGQSVAEVPHRLATHAMNGEPLFLMFIKDSEGEKVRGEVDQFEF